MIFKIFLLGVLAIILGVVLIFNPVLGDEIVSAGIGTVLLGIALIAVLLRVVMSWVSGSPPHQIVGARASEEVKAAETETGL